MAESVMAVEYALFHCRHCDGGDEFSAWLPPVSEQDCWPSCPDCGNTRPRLVCLLEPVESCAPDSSEIDFASFFQLYCLEALLSDDLDALDHALDRLEPEDRERFQAILNEVVRRQEPADDAD